MKPSRPHRDAVYNISESSVSLRPLTPSERTAAREKATAARATRAKVKAELKSGRRTVADVLEAAGADEAVGRLRVSEMLEALPRIGHVRAAALMEELGIAETRRVRGLGVHQRTALIRQFP